MKVSSLGRCLAELDEVNHRLTVVSPARDGLDFFIPSSSVSIYQEQHIIALRDMLNSAYPKEQPELKIRTNFRVE